MRVSNWSDQFRRWRHQGEDGATAIYRLGSPNFAAVFITVICCVIVPAVIRGARRVWIVWILFAVNYMPYAFTARRRALIVTPSGLAYRPSFGSIRTVNWSDIDSVEHSSVPVPAGLFAGFFVSGVVFIFKDYNRNPVAFPLDLSNRSELLKLIRDNIGKSIKPRRSILNPNRR